MKLYLVAGAHHEVPNSLSTAHLTPAAADASALRMVNMIRADTPRDGADSDEQTPPLAPIPEGGDWRAGLKEAQRALISYGAKIPLTGPARLGDLDEALLMTESRANVEIVEITIDDPPGMPAALDDVFTAGMTLVEAMDEAIDTHIYYEPQDERPDPEPYGMAAEGLREALHIMRWAAIWQGNKAPGGYVGAVPILFESPPCKSWSSGDAGQGSHEESFAGEPAASAAYALADAADRAAGAVFYGDEGEDQVKDEAKWLVTAELFINGKPAEGYSGYVPGDTADEALATAMRIIQRRYEGVKAYTLKALAPSKGGEA